MQAVVYQVCAGLVTAAVLWVAPRARRGFAGMLAAARALERAAPAVQRLEEASARADVAASRLETAARSLERRVAS